MLHSSKRLTCVLTHIRDSFFWVRTTTYIHVSALSMPNLLPSINKPVHIITPTELEDK